MPKPLLSWPTAFALAFIPCVAPQVHAAAAVQAAPADLADVAQGTYFGNVMSDARGSSRSDVRITVTKTGRNQVRISSDYDRLPVFTATLTRALDTIQNVDGSEVFLLDLSRRPHALNVTVDDASWAGTRE